MAKIQESSDGLLAIITDILNFSEMDTGEARLHTGRFNLLQDLEMVRTQTQGLLQQKAVTFELETSGAGGDFFGDASRIRQTLLILCNNAAKFTASGSIFLRCAVTEQDGHAVTAHIAVEDTGIGIAGEHLDNLFDSFHQVDDGMTRQFGGIGLGLAMAGQAVALMGGRLEVESAVGRGSRFFFSISLERFSPEEERAPDGRDATQPESAEVALFPGRVLIVEDNELNRMIIVELVEQAGLQTETVDNGQKAVDRIREQAFDLVLMDLQMPVMGGVEATRLIRGLPSGSAGKLPIIALTANAQESNRAECVDAGMNGFLSKPIDVEALYTTFRQWLPGNGARE